MLPVLFASPMAALAPLTILAASLLAALLQAPPELLDALETLLRLSVMALTVIPVTEIRRLFGGFPAIPLPGGKSIAAGRWVSWVAAFGMDIFGHAAGWLKPMDLADPRAAVGLEVAVMAVLANIIYQRWWKEQLGLPGDPPPAV